MRIRRPLQILITLAVAGLLLQPAPVPSAEPTEGGASSSRGRPWRKRPRRCPAWAGRSLTNWESPAPSRRGSTPGSDDGNPARGKVKVANFLALRIAGTSRAAHRAADLSEASSAVFPWVGIPWVDGIVWSTGLTETAAINHWVEQE